MKAQCFRNHCEVGKNRVTLDALKTNYLCKCGKNVYLVAIADDFIVSSHKIMCNRCGEVDDVMHVSKEREIFIESHDIIEGLPEEMRNALLGSSQEVSEDIKDLLY